MPSKNLTWTQLHPFILLLIHSASLHKASICPSDLRRASCLPQLCTACHIQTIVFYCSVVEMTPDSCTGILSLQAGFTLFLRKQLHSTKLCISKRAHTWTLSLRRNFCFNGESREFEIGTLSLTQACTLHPRAKCWGSLEVRDRQVLYFALQSQINLELWTRVSWRCLQRWDNSSRSSCVHKEGCRGYQGHISGNIQAYIVFLWASWSPSKRFISFVYWEFVMSFPWTIQPVWRLTWDSREVKLWAQT